jgi:hypothetical protein
MASGRPRPYPAAERAGLPRHGVTKALTVIADVLNGAYDRQWTAKDLVAHLSAKHGQARWDDLDSFAGEKQRLVLEQRPQ